MEASVRKHGQSIFALGAVMLLSLAGAVEARNPYPQAPPSVAPPPPKSVKSNPPSVIPPPPPPPIGTPDDIDDPDPGCDDCGIPPGGVEHVPEPATLVSGLFGVGLMGLYALRRRRKDEAGKGRFRE